MEWRNASPHQAARWRARDGVQPSAWLMTLQKQVKGTWSEQLALYSHNVRLARSGGRGEVLRPRSENDQGDRVRGWTPTSVGRSLDSFTNPASLSRLCRSTRLSLARLIHFPHQISTNMQSIMNLLQPPPSTYEPLDESGKLRKTSISGRAFIVTGKHLTLLWKPSLNLTADSSLIGVMQELRRGSAVRPRSCWPSRAAGSL